MQAVIDHLKALSLVVESSGGRVMRYAHNVGKVLAIPSQSVALLAALMLRGPQTAGELRINCERLHHFSDISAVEGFLHELAAREAGALVVELPRQPGTRETRWAHLLSGPPAADTVVRMAAGEGDVVTVSELAALRANVARAARRTRDHPRRTVCETVQRTRAFRRPESRVDASLRDIAHRAAVSRMTIPRRIASFHVDPTTEQFHGSQQLR